MGDHNSISDDMDEGMAPPPLEDESDPFHFTPLDLDLTLIQLSSVAESGDDDDVVSMIVDLMEVNSFSGLQNLMHAFLGFLAPETVGSSPEDRLEYMRQLRNQSGSKCRCDAQWYAREGVENVAFGCKTCAMSSASCICVSCFEAGDHEGHDFYISKSDYGCCDCGDIYAWKKSGFCNQHPGPDLGDDPILRLHPWTRKNTELTVTGLLTGVWRITKEDFLATSEMMEVCLQFLLELAAMHDGLRRIIGRTLICCQADGSCLADSYLDKSHLFTPAARQLWTKLLVDLMLDLEFKMNFSSVFAKRYSAMVISRLDDVHRMNDIGDFTCQMFTRPDVALHLTVNFGIVSVLLETAVNVIDRAMVDLNPDAIDSGPSHGFSASMTFRNLIQNVLEGGNLQLEFVDEEAPPGPILDEGGQIFSFEESSGASHAAEPLKILDHGHASIKTHDAFQSSMDLIYILDHPEVVDRILTDPKLLESYWQNFLQLVRCLQFMNPHRRRTDVHVEFPDSNWSGPLTAQGDLISSYWLIMEGLSRHPNPGSILRFMTERTESVLAEWLSKFDSIDFPSEVASLFCVLNRILGMLVFDQLLIGAGAVSLPPYAVHLPLRARALHSEVGLGLWVRNGESLNMESRFYDAPFFHHHMRSADSKIFRIQALFSDLDVWFPTMIGAFENAQSGYLHLLCDLMSQQTELALNESGLVAQRVTALLAVQDRTFSQLKDMKLERWTHTLTPKQTKILEQVLATIAQLSEEGPSFKLLATQWLSLDLLSPFFGWREMQTAEEHLMDHLKRKSMTLKDWFRCNQTVQPVLLGQFRDPFTKFLSSEWILGSVLFALIQARKNPEEFRSLKFVIHVVLRLCYPNGPLWRDRKCPASSRSSPVSLSQVDIDELTLSFRKMEWCHPWSVEFLIPSEESSPISILSILTDLETREQSQDMKAWLALVIGEISGQCRLIASQEVATEATSPKDVKRKRMQEALMKRLSKKQDAFLFKTSSTPPGESVSVATKSTECVVCLGGSERPVGTLGYISPSAWTPFGARAIVPTRNQLIPATLSDSHFLPLEIDSPKKHFITRSCGHTLHRECWNELNESQRTAKELRGFVLCPYCNRPANILLDLESVEAETMGTMARLMSVQTGTGPIGTLTELLEMQLDQLALSHRKPSGETDLVSLQKSSTSLLSLFKRSIESNPSAAELMARSTRPIIACLIGSERETISTLFETDWRSELLRGVSGIPQSDSRKACIQAVEMSLKPWLYRAHVCWHYLVTPTHEMPFDELVSIESMLSVSDEFQVLVDQLPFGPLESIESVWQEGQWQRSNPLPETLLMISSDRVESKYIDSFIKREKCHYISLKKGTLFQYLPTIIPVIPSVYQKLYTAYLKATCTTCKTVPRQAVVCLVCGKVLCLQTDCCLTEDVGEITYHFSAHCAVNGIGIFLQLSNAEVHLISTEGAQRIMVAQWGSLFLDSHGEEDMNLSKPLQFSQHRFEKLVNEIRENSWLWKQGSKNLTWRRPIGQL